MRGPHFLLVNLLILLLANLTSAFADPSSENSSAADENCPTLIERMAHQYRADFIEAARSGSIARIREAGYGLALITDQNTIKDQLTFTLKRLTEAPFLKNSGVLEEVLLKILNRIESDLLHAASSSRSIEEQSQWLPLLKPISDWRTPYSREEAELLYDYAKEYGPTIDGIPFIDYIIQRYEEFRRVHGFSNSEDEDYFPDLDALERDLRGIEEADNQLARSFMKRVRSLLNSVRELHPDPALREQIASVLTNWAQEVQRTKNSVRAAEQDELDLMCMLIHRGDFESIQLLILSGYPTYLLQQGSWNERLSPIQLAKSLRFFRIAHYLERKFRQSPAALSDIRYAKRLRRSAAVRGN